MIPKKIYKWITRENILKAYLIGAGFNLLLCTIYFLLYSETGQDEVVGDAFFPVVMYHFCFWGLKYGFNNMYTTSTSNMFGSIFRYTESEKKRLQIFELFSVNFFSIVLIITAIFFFVSIFFHGIFKREFNLFHYSLNPLPLILVGLSLHLMKEKISKK